TTFGSNRNPRTARPSGTSDFSSTAKRRLSPTFRTPSAGVKRNCTILERSGMETTVASTGLDKLVSTAFAVPAALVLTAATSAAERLLTSDFGAGTNVGNSSAGVCLFTLCIWEAVVSLAPALFTTVFSTTVGTLAAEVFGRVFAWVACATPPPFTSGLKG